MPTMAQNKRAERKDIIQWLMVLKKRETVLGARFERLNRTIQRLINSFTKEHNIDLEDNWNELRRKVSDADLLAFKTELEVLLGEGITAEAKVEAKKMSITKKNDALDYLVALAVIETIRMMNFIETEINVVVKSTIESELIKQRHLIGLPNQYLENHLDSIYKSAMTQNKWSERLWGEHQVGLRSDVERLIRESLQRGYNPRKIAKELGMITDKGKYNAVRLMRTEQARVQAQSQLETYKAQNVYKYDIMPEPSACKICKDAASHNPYNVADAEIGVNIMPFHPNCKCSTVGVLE